MCGVFVDMLFIPLWYLLPLKVFQGWFLEVAFWQAMFIIGAIPTKQRYLISEHCLCNSYTSDHRGLSIDTITLTGIGNGSMLHHHLRTKSPMLRHSL